MQLSLNIGWTWVWNKTVSPGSTSSWTILYSSQDEKKIILTGINNAVTALQNNFVLIFIFQLLLIFSQRYLRLLISRILHHLFLWSLPCCLSYKKLIYVISGSDIYSVIFPEYHSQVNSKSILIRQKKLCLIKENKVNYLLISISSFWWMAFYLLWMKTKSW